MQDQRDKIPIGKKIIFVILAVLIVGATFFVISENYAVAHGQSIIMASNNVLEKNGVRASSNILLETNDKLMGLIFDLESDSSLQKYLSSQTPFDDLNYKPSDIAKINSDFTANNSKKFMLRQEAWIQFADMAWNFRNENNGDRFWITSAYRSKWFQDLMIKNGCSRSKCAQAGASEHQAWLALDIGVVTKWWKSVGLDKLNKYTERLEHNAHRFWFHNTYQKWIDIDGQIVEWWHRRYLWVELATVLHEKNQTIAEFYKNYSVSVIVPSRQNTEDR